MVEILLGFTYVALIAYSGLCAPDIFFRVFRFRDTPEYALAYLFTCLFMAVTLLGGIGRVAFALHDARNAKTD